MRERHTDVLSLHPVERSRLFRSAEECRSRLRTIRVRDVALRVIAGAAVRARAAADRRRHDDAVAHAEVAHAFAELFDNADTFMAEDRARHHAWHRAAHHVQIGPADRARRQANDCVIRLTKLRLRDVVQGYLTDVMPHYSLHDSVLRPRAGRQTRLGAGARGAFYSVEPGRP